MIDSKIRWPDSGRYIVALSGGVDSVVLLDLMAEQAAMRGYDLEIAHFNHGWEGDDAYEAAVRTQITRYDLPLHVGRGGTDRNEAAARKQRYEFLRSVLSETGAEAIVTAHHLDDLEETVILNLRRGTGRRGLTPFAAVKDVVRPLVDVRKRELIDLAGARGLTWCHDSYNDDLTFRRNAVRKELLKLRESHNFNQTLSEGISEAARLNQDVDEHLRRVVGEGGIEPASLRRMNPPVIQEVIVALAYAAQPDAELDSRTVESLAIDIKTGRFTKPELLTKRLSAHISHGRLEVVFIP